MKIEQIVELLERVHKCVVWDEQGDNEHIAEWVSSKECSKAIECIKALTHKN